MNAVSVSRDEVIINDNAGDSDSDTNSDGIPDYYHPISTSDGDGDDNEPISNGYHYVSGTLFNGHDHPPALENGVMSMNVSECEVEKEERDSEDEEEEEEMRSRAESDFAIRRAFQEDESRRNAPLPSENAARVLEAMRGVSLSGFAPDWGNQVPEDRWADQLRRLRQPPRSTA